MTKVRCVQTNKLKENTNKISVRLDLLYLIGK